MRWKNVKLQYTSSSWTQKASCSGCWTAQNFLVPFRISRGQVLWTGITKCSWKILKKTTKKNKQTNVRPGEQCVYVYCRLKKNKTKPTLEMIPPPTVLKYVDAQLIIKKKETLTSQNVLFENNRVECVLKRLYYYWNCWIENVFGHFVHHN